MTPPVIALSAIVLAPVLALMILRINAALVFLSLCLGDVLVQFVAKDTSEFLTLHANKVPQAVNTGNNNVKLALLLLPVILTAIFMIRTVRGRGKLIINVLPAAGVGLLGALLVVPLLPPGLAHNVVGSSLWTGVNHAQNLIVGASAVVCLLALWLQRPGSGHSKHGKH